MKAQTVTIIVLVMLISCGCLWSIEERKESWGKECDLKCEPVVVVSGIDYSSDSESVPYEDAHSDFSENYSGSHLTFELRTALINCMTEKAETLGENGTILEASVRETYEDWQKRPRRIPTYAEKAIYKNESIWAIGFNRANGFSESSLSHFDLFFVSIQTMEIKLTDGCNGTAVVYSFGCN